MSPQTQAEFWNEFLKRDISFLSREASGKTHEASFFSNLFDTSRRYVDALRGGHILEIGCGDGMDSIALALRYDCKVTALDVSPRRVELARANVERFGVSSRVEVRLGNAMALEFHDRCFDGAFANSVMLFLNHDQACRELTRVLKAGASVVLTNESMALSPLVRLSRKMGLGYRSRELESHVRERLSPVKIEALAARHFSRVEYSPHFGLLMQLFWGVRLLVDRLICIFRHIDVYHKPEAPCPSVIKRVDRALVEKWPWYRQRTWIAVVRFVR